MVAMLPFADASHADSHALLRLMIVFFFSPRRHAPRRYTPLPCRYDIAATFIDIALRLRRLIFSPTLLLIRHAADMMFILPLLPPLTLFSPAR